MKKTCSFIFVGNWKMNQPLQDSIDFFKKNQSGLKALGEKNIPIVICPSFPAIPFVLQEIGDTPVYIGAQDCSAFSHGAYTGNVSADMLANIGCTFCIVGHSERRKLFGESNKDITSKVMQLVESKIVPIICVGETLEENKKDQTTSVLEKQLAPVLKAIKGANYLDKPICIAYEPIWSIGTGKIPTIEELEKIFDWLHSFIKKNNVENFALLYGGSVDSNNSNKLKTVKFVDGFLIGGASLDFQELKKIVLS